MDPIRTIKLKKSEAQLIVNALAFVADNLEFKNLYFISMDGVLRTNQKIKEQIDAKPKFSSPRGIFDITNGWK